MAKRKSNSPIHSSGRCPLESIDSLHPSSLPPELGSLDMAWDDDPRSVGTIDLLQNSELVDIDVEGNERTTEIPTIPIDLLVRATMAEADARESATECLGASVPVTVSPDIGVKSPDAEINSVRHVDASHASSAPTNPAATSLAEERPQRTTPDSVDTRAITPSEPHLRPLEGEKPLGTGKPPSSRPIAQRTPSHLDAPQSSTAKSHAPTVDSLPPAPSTGSRMTAPPTMRQANVAQVRHQMKDCYATGDFSGALELSEALLRADPGDLEAQRFVTSCRDVLTQMLASRIGSLEQYVQIALSADELRWLNLDHRAGFFLSLVDGTLTIEELLDISGMARLESLRILTTLLDQHVLRLDAH